MVSQMDAETKDKIAKTDAEWRQQLTPEQYKVARQHGFQVTSHKMELYGFCESCQRAIAGGDSPRA